MLLKVKKWWSDCCGCFITLTSCLYLENQKIKRQISARIKPEFSFRSLWPSPGFLGDVASLFLQPRPSSWRRGSFSRSPKPSRASWKNSTSTCTWLRKCWHVSFELHNCSVFLLRRWQAVQRLKAAFWWVRNPPFWSCRNVYCLGQSADRTFVAFPLTCSHTGVSYVRKDDAEWQWHNTEDGLKCVVIATTLWVRQSGGVLF